MNDTLVVRVGDLAYLVFAAVTWPWLLIGLAALVTAHILLWWRRRKYRQN